jgi:type I restriction enzyme S subunit
VKAGWEVKPLGEVCELVNGKAYKKAELLDKGKYPVLRVGNFFTSHKWFHSDLELEPKKYCHNGDLLYAWSASFGPRIWEGEKSIFHYHIWNVQHPADVLDRKFLYYYFDWDKEKIKLEQGAGATMIHVSKGSMEGRALPIPPLEEQKRIVAILDAAFEGLTRAKENAETNLQNARELFEEAKDEILTASDGSWLNGTLEALVGPVSTGPFGSLLHKSDYVPNETPIVNPAHIISGRIVPDMNKTIGQNTLERLGSYVMKTGDIVFGRRGDMGRCATVSELENGWLCGTGSFYIRPKQDVETELVSHLLRSRSYVKTLESLSTGATMLNINNKTLAGLEMTLPPAVGQLAILEKINELETRTDQIKREFAAKLTDIAELRQSLLQKAFAGELT